jgi:hypothetical protein
VYLLSSSEFLGVGEAHGSGEAGVALEARVLPWDLSPTMEEQAYEALRLWNEAGNVAVV